jgi:hypothetical protein
MVAVFSYILTQHYQRKIFSKVEYHRKGPNAETYPCVEIGNRIAFTPGGGESKLFGSKRKEQRLTVVNRAKPEIKVFGFKTIRLHHVIEGWGETVDIRDLKEKTPSGAGTIATSEAVMSTAFENMQKAIPKSKGDWMMWLIFAGMGVAWGIVISVAFHIGA